MRKCHASLEVAKFLVMAANPDRGSLLAESRLSTSKYFNYSSTCYNELEHSVLALGPLFTQVVSMAKVGGYDGQVSVKWGRNVIVADLQLHRTQESLLQI